MSMSVGLNLNSSGIGSNYATNPFTKGEESKKDRQAYMNFFQGFNQGTGQQTEASAIRACGNSIDLSA